MSANEFKGEIVPGTAGEALTKYRFIKDDGTANEASSINLADSGDAPDGISCDTYSSGAGCAYAINGTGYLTVLGSTGGAIAKGDWLKPAADNSGKGIKAGTDRDKYGAKAMEPSAADGDKIQVQIIQGERSTA